MERVPIVANRFVISGNPCRRLVYLFTMLLFAVGNLLGCSYTSGYLESASIINTLNNRGVVPLSSSNPYLAGNKLVSDLVSSSPDIRGFVEYSGAPRAIEVIKPVLGTLKVRFYYPNKKQFYELTQSGESWVIEGPFRIPSEGLKILAEVVEAEDREPKLLFYDSHMKNAKIVGGEGKTLRAKGIDGGRRSYASFAGSSFKKKIVGHGSAGQGTGHAMASTKPNVEKNNRMKVLQGKLVAGKIATVDRNDREQRILAKIIELQDKITQQAEVTPQGDVVHYVTYPGETLSIIARWYTHNRENVGRIVRVNDLKNPSRLEIGDVIVIPSYLVRSKKLLTQEALTKLLSLVNG